MKRKIALLLAGVMALTTLPSVGVFAATDTILTPSAVTIKSGDDTLFVENNVVSDFPKDSTADYDTVSNVGFYLDIAHDRGTIREGSTMTVTLTDAEWAFDQTRGGVEPFDTSKGSYVGNTYYKTTGSGLAYELMVSRADASIATLLLKEDLTSSSGSIILPIVAIADGDGDAKVTLSGGSATSGTWTFGVIGTTSTRTTVKTVRTGVDYLADLTISITEGRPGTIKGKEIKDANDDDYYVDIEAPDGVEFRVGSNSNYYDVEVSGGFVETNDNNLSDVVTVDVVGSDRDVLRLNLGNLKRSTGTNGVITIANVDLLIDDSKYGEGDIIELEIIEAGDTDIDEESFKVGEITIFGVGLSAGSAREIFAGDFNNSNQNTPSSSSRTHDDFKTARITFKETAADSWSTRRRTEFQLPDGVKFRAVEVKKADNIVASNGNSISKKYYVGNSNEAIIVEDDTVKISGLSVPNRDKVIELQMDIWVSVAADYEGDIELTATGGGVSDQSVVIAVAKQRFSASYKDGVLRITENEAGAFGNDKELWVTVTDGRDPYEWSRGADAVEVGGSNLDLDVTLERMSGYGYGRTSGAAILDTVMVIENSRKSRTASTIEISPVPVPTDGTRTYITISGDALAANYDWIAGEHDDTFDVPGLEIIVNPTGTESNKTTTGLSTAEVKLAIGSGYYTIDGVSYPMDTQAFIDPKTDSVMVPIRFCMNAFGLTDPDAIIWDSGTQTVTVRLPNGSSWVQLTVGSNTALVNGVPLPMVNGRSEPVVAQNIEGRVFLPFRALGTMLGISVDWDDATRTAIYNKK